MNPSYKFRDALKDAGKVYKKTMTNPVTLVKSAVGKTAKQLGPLIKYRGTRKGGRRSRHSRK